jgi:peptide/nickel transport system substrate-binding protein
MSNKGVNYRRLKQILVSTAILALLISACGPTPEPQVVEKVVTQVVKETVMVAGTPQVVEKMVTEVVEVEKVVTATPVPAGEQKPTGQIIVAQTADPNTMDPKFLKGRETQNALRLIYDSLYHRDNNMQIIPWLSTSYENPDELTWRLHLREGVKFHNGNDFKADDVKFTIERLLEEDSGWSERNLIERAEVVDDYTVDVITKKPYAAFMTRAVLWHMTDKEYFDQVGADGFASQPVGTGPFTFVEWVKDEQLVFEANPDYWGGAPKIETVIFRPIPETATRVAALEAGDVDIITDVPPDYVDQVPDNIAVVSIPGTRAFFIGMNVTVKPFDDVRVRQAMNYAVDVDTIIKSMLNGLARKLDGPVLPEAFGYVATPVYNYDPDKAKALLAEAGYPDGFEMELDA